jgi:protein gp37
MRRYIRQRYGEMQLPFQIWLGVSIENNDYAWRADMLRECNVAVRSLSIEPMLGPVDRVSFDKISWVIVGGESGPDLRRTDAAWVRGVRDRCTLSGIAFFFKQWHKKNTGRLLDGQTWNEVPTKRDRETRAPGRLHA